jgi:hypothetical protein
LHNPTNISRDILDGLCFKATIEEPHLASPSG